MWGLPAHAQFWSLDQGRWTAEQEQKGWRESLSHLRELGCSNQQYCELETIRLVSKLMELNIRERN